jgi:Tripartite tricarboxylate transporter family receptor
MTQMKLLRRNILHLAAGAAALPAASRIARAQAYPSRPVRIIVGFPAGGTADIGARLSAQGLSERLGQQFVVENRVSAGTHAATEAVVRAPADGYTLLLVTLTNAVNVALYNKLNYDFIRDIAPIAGRGPRPCATGLLGWAYRIRTGESVRELPDWNYGISCPEVGAGGAAEMLYGNFPGMDKAINFRKRAQCFEKHAATAMDPKAPNTVKEWLTQVPRRRSG